MMEAVFPFDELPPERQTSAGGKGRTLTRLYQAGYPVPSSRHRCGGAAVSCRHRRMGVRHPGRGQLW